jgi:prophage regulatory protein
MAKTPQRMLRRKDVEVLTGLPRSTIYAGIAAGTFPKPVFPDGRRSVRWLESEIAAWQQKQIAARDRARAHGRRRAA